MRQFLLVCGLIVVLASPQGAGAADGPDGGHHHSVPPDKSAGEEEAMELGDHHLVRGRLAAEAADRRMEDFVRDWTERSEARRSTAPVFAEYIEDLGTARLVAWFQNRPGTCHGELHDLGRVIDDLTHDVTVAVAICSDACTYGCTHGALKRHFGHAASKEGGEDAIRAARDELVALCRGGLLVPGFFRGNCAHAAGHAFGILGEKTEAARSLCEAFPTELGFYCETGVYMQIMGPLGRELDRRSGDSRGGRLDVRIDYCASQAVYMSACLRFLLNPFREAGDFGLLAGRCESFSGRVRLGCFNALGYLARVHIIRNPDEFDAFCGRGDVTDRQMCVSGFAFAKKGHGGAVNMDRACRSLSDPALSEFCLSQHARHYYQIGNENLSRMF